MIRTLNLVTLALTVTICFGLYKITNETRGADRELSRVNASIAAEQETIDVLQAEWSLLVQPARLQELSGRYLALQAVSATQISTIDRIPYRTTPDEDAPEAPRIAVAPLRNPFRSEAPPST